MRYWRVTSGDKDLGTKGPYEPDAALKVTSLQAWHFVGIVKWAAREGGIICAPYDAELFGHWWHEGPDWLKEVYRLMAADDELEGVTLSQDLAENPPGECIALPQGSWGAGGGDDVWLNNDTRWIWETLYPLAQRLEKVLAGHHPGENPRLDILVDTAKRQLLFAEASDWPFLITTGHVKDYAERRFLEHASATARLLDTYERTSAEGAFEAGDGVELDRLNNDDFPFRGLL
jgi:1,4-alpha-glucan branching enzyme